MVVVSVGVGVGASWAGSQGGASVGGLPVFAACGILAFGLNWLVFVPSYLTQTERYFDLTGSLTYLGSLGIAFLMTDVSDLRGLLLGGMVAIWAIRLGSFLFKRILRSGHDGRFDILKRSFSRFLMTWTLQGLWVLLTVSAALAAITSSHPAPLGAVGWGGVVLWLFGFGLEVVADNQKARFRADPSNHAHFIQTGLWAWSRHPNYFGEITLWSGIVITAMPVLAGWQYVTLLSPVFVYLLLTRISGVPLLEERAHKRWGNLATYRAYTERTPVLFPRPPRAASTTV